MGRTSMTERAPELSWDATALAEAGASFARAVGSEAVGDHAAAVEAASITLQLDPHHAGAVALLGLCRIREGHRRIGQADQRRAASLAHEDPYVLYFLGVGAWECEDGQRSIEVLTKAAKADMPHPRCATVLAQVLELTNRLDEAQAVLDRFSVSDPASQLLGARLRRRSGDYEDALALLAEIDTDATGADRRLIHAERGRCLDLRGETDRAWDQIKLANAIAAQRSTHPDISPWFDRLATFHRQQATRQRLAAGPTPLRRPALHSAQIEDEPSGDLPESCPRAFVVGFPRSGTTLIESLLTTGRGVTSTREVEAMAHAVAQVCSATGRGYLQLLSSSRESDPESIRTAYLRGLDDHLVDTTSIVIDKLPMNVLYLGAIELAFPEAALVVARRHPADAVLSAYFEQFADNAGTSQLNSLGGAARLYNSVIALWEAFRDSTNLRWIEVDYQDLVTNPEFETARISEFLGLGLDSTALLGSRFSTARINTPSYTDAGGPAHRRSIGRWRRYRHQLAPVLNELGVTP